MPIDCPHCNKAIGGSSTEGGYRVRLGIVLIDDQTGRIHGPCPQCKQDVTVAEGATLSKALVAEPKPIRGRRRRLVRLGLPLEG